MPAPLYGVNEQDEATPIRVNKRGRLQIADSGVLWILVVLEALQLATLIVLVVMRL